MRLPPPLFFPPFTFIRCNRLISALLHYVLSSKALNKPHIVVFSLLVLSDYESASSRIQSDISCATGDNFHFNSAIKESNDDDNRQDKERHENIN